MMNSLHANGATRKSNHNTAIRAVSLLSAFVVLFSLTFISITLTTSTIAYADNGAGSNSTVVVDGEKLRDPFYWKYYYDPTPIQPGAVGTPWKRFTGISGGMAGAGLSGLSTNKTLEHFKTVKVPAGMTNASFQKVCERSQAIWWVAGSSVWANGRATGWKFNGDTVTYPSTKSSSKYAKFLNAGPFYGSVFNRANQGYKFQTLMNTYLADKKSTKYVIACSGVFEPPKVCIPGGKVTPECPGTTVVCKPGDVSAKCPGTDKTHVIPTSVTTEEEYSTQTPKSFNITEPYSYAETITRHNLDGYGNDPIGKDNLHDQPMITKMTNYGKLIDQIAAGAYANTDVDVVKGLISEAIEKDKKEKHISASLDAQNKEGMAEGGILDVNEYTKWAKADLYQLNTKTYKRTKTVYTTKSTDAEGNEIILGPFTTYSEWELKSDVTTYDHSSEMGTQQLTGFWQMLSVHCNEKGFNDLVSETGATVENAGNPDKGIAAVAYSKQYEDFPEEFDFGNYGEPSSQLGFYDKECPYECRKETAQSATTVGKMPGATSGGSVQKINTDNSPNTGKATLSDDKFTFFRDNESHNVKIDTWAPISSGPIGAIGDVLSTTIVRWNAGTPGLTPGENGNGGQFKMLTADKSSVFEAKNDSEPPTQKNDFGDKSKTLPFKNKFSALFKGKLDLLRIQGTWASTDKAPLNFNIKWEYAPVVSTTFSANDIGFGVEGKQELGSTATATARVEGKCYAEYGTTKSKFDTKEPFYDFTGTDSDNTLDSNIVEDPSTDFTNPVAQTTNLLIRFVRATTE